MKTIFLAMLASSGTLWGCSQQLTGTHLPSLVQNALQVKFPAAQNIEWEKEGNLYEAEFTVNLVEHTALVDATGKVMSYKQDITSAQLPETVTVALKRDYQAFQMDELEKVEKDGQVVYQVELENANEEVKKVYAPDGTQANVIFWD
ncbi:PepSY-like domain-containing protein [Rufibacter sediminis]|uniref:Putative beta-lactamase-inhibitor-like PepSY-like domain-containing protein n=1 Tax=Rufibacter sediminis TaxID=2762756 RepID=A0ABR6VN04_9BACT|nr:PepSY-like domain-containing protein [Rufibacter sediminis]MBC3538542.1 hypothetical protein [Rufibacter sediminis]